MEAIKLWPYGHRSIIAHPQLGWVELEIHHIKVENGVITQVLGRMTDEDEGAYPIEWGMEDGVSTFHAEGIVGEKIRRQSGREPGEVFVDLVRAAVGVPPGGILGQDAHGWLCK